MVQAQSLTRRHSSLSLSISTRAAAVTFSVGAALLLSLAVLLLVPQRYMLAALPLGLLAVQTWPVRAAVDVSLGLQSYFTGSLSRAPWAPWKRSAAAVASAALTAAAKEVGAASTAGGLPASSQAAAVLGRSAVVYRAGVLPAYDVVTDTVLDALLVRPLPPQGPQP